MRRCAQRRTRARPPQPADQAAQSSLPSVPFLSSAAGECKSKRTSAPYYRAVKICVRASERPSDIQKFHNPSTVFQNSPSSQASKPSRIISQRPNEIDTNHFDTVLRWVLRRRAGVCCWWCATILRTNNRRTLKWQACTNILHIIKIKIKGQPFPSTARIIRYTSLFE